MLMLCITRTINNIPIAKELTAKTWQVLIDATWTKSCAPVPVMAAMV